MRGGGNERDGAMAARSALPMTTSRDAPISVLCGLSVLPSSAHFGYIFLRRFLPAFHRFVTMPSPWLSPSVLPTPNPSGARRIAPAVKLTRAEDATTDHLYMSETLLSRVACRLFHHAMSICLDKLALFALNAFHQILVSKTCLLRQELDDECC